MTGPALTDLPVETCVDQIRLALAGEAHAVLQAPPGAGKTTLVPLRLIDEPWLDAQRILVLEPRRLATRAAANRMASLLGERVGVTVGYSMRDERQVGPRARVEVVTDGILTRRLQHDPALPGIGLVVFDEVHERHLQTDLALALTLDARAVLRPELRLLAMSATLDTRRVAEMLGRPKGPAPVVISPGRQHPVEVRWIPPAPGRRDDDAMAAAIAAAAAGHHGDILAFLPGAREIRWVQATLAGRLPAGVDVVPLFGALPAAEQDDALCRVPARSAAGRAGHGHRRDQPHRRRCAGRHRRWAGPLPRYDPGTGLTRLHTGPASRSSADQRAGRAGRQGAGVAYRLWSPDQHGRRRPLPQAEIETVDLAALVLELAVWGTEPRDLAFQDPPPQAALDDGRALLVKLGALDAGGRPTPEGRHMADLPLHPRLARMVTGAIPLGLGHLSCAVATLLEDRDVLRGRRDDVGVDIAERVRLITEPGRRHPSADLTAVSSARRRAARLARRVGVDPGVERAPLDVDSCGLVLALAYPDRIAQAVGRGRFRLRTGAGAWMLETDALAGQAFLVVAELDGDQRDSRIRLACALDSADLEAAAGAAIMTVSAITWDAGRDDLRETVTRRLDGLVLGTTERKAAPGPDVAAALLRQVRATRLGALRWTDAARSLQHRVMFLRRAVGTGWPDLSDAALLATLDDWLAPRLVSAADRADLEAVDVTQALRIQLGHGRLAELDTLAPTTVAVSPRRKLRLDYRHEQPRASVRIQELFGVRRHPMVVAGRVPIVLNLLSPAGRPVQITSDLPGFWAGSYAAVRKELAGRYPKHDWPIDPAG